MSHCSILSRPSIRWRLPLTSCSHTSSVWTVRRLPKSGPGDAADCCETHQSDSPRSLHQTGSQRKRMRPWTPDRVRVARSEPSVVSGSRVCPLSEVEILECITGVEVAHGCKCTRKTTVLQKSTSLSTLLALYRKLVLLGQQSVPQDGDRHGPWNA